MTTTIGDVLEGAEAWHVEHGDSLWLLKCLPSCSVDAVVTDPPAGIKFMGRKWDDDRGGRRQWIAWLAAILTECRRVMKPGAHALIWALPRTAHWTGTAIEDAGLDVRQKFYHHFGSAIPKSHNVSKAIDKKRDDVPEVRAVCRWLRAEMERAGKSAQDIAAEFGFHSRMIDHWAARDTDSQPTLPTLQQWDALRELLAFGDEMDLEVLRLNLRKGQPGEAWADRPSVGAGKSSCFNSSTPENTRTVGALRFEAYDVTTGATDDAKRWEGFGTDVKPATEEWILARKPLEGTVAANVCKHGTGALNLDATRVGVSPQRSSLARGASRNVCGGTRGASRGSSRGPVSSVPDTDRDGPLCICAEPPPCSICGTVPEPGGAPPGDIPRAGDQAGRSQPYQSGASVPGCAQKATAEPSSRSDCPACLRFCDGPSPTDPGRGQGAAPSAPGAPGDSDSRLREPGHSRPRQRSGRLSSLGDSRLSASCANPVTYSARPQTAGRFPSNLLLTHSGSCQRVGSRDVKGSSGSNSVGEGGLVGSQIYGDGHGRTEESPRGFGRETVAAYHCAPGCPVAELDAQSGNRPGMTGGGKHRADYPGGMFGAIDSTTTARCDSGGASRFFPCFEWTSEDFWPFGYFSKASTAERNKGTTNDHSTVKSIALMRWLVRLVTPPGGLVLDPFCGSGSTLIAAGLEGARSVGVDLDAHHCDIARARVRHCLGGHYEGPRMPDVDTENAKAPTQGSLF